MNKKGFTLIELLAVIVLIGLITAVTIPSVFTLVEGSKQREYELLKDNIVEAAQIYTNEYHETITWVNEGSTSVVIIPASDLVNAGLLKTHHGKVINPINDQDITHCMGVTATKNNTTKKITYVLNNDCDA